MTREQQLRAAEAREQSAARIRTRLGLINSAREENTRDWLLGPGAIPMAVAALALLVYAGWSVITALTG
jgi:hypothetical protein